MMGKEKGILLVEDTEEDVILTLRALKKSKVLNEVTVARDGTEALDYLFCQGRFAGRDKSHLPALVLLDLKLPKVDGIQVLQRLRSEPGTRFVPVVILTSSKEQEDLLNGYKFGANSYIRKPVDFDQFSQAVQQLGLYWLLLNEAPPEA
jgi:two-component system, response regulator